MGLRVAVAIVVEASRAEKESRRYWRVRTASVRGDIGEAKEGVVVLAEIDTNTRGLAVFLFIF